MKCKAEVIFKSVNKRSAGQFTQKDTGEIREYKEAYTITFDTINKDGKIKEERAAFNIENTDFYNRLNRLSAYTKIELEFDLNYFRIEPINFLEIEE